MKDVIQHLTDNTRKMGNMLTDKLAAVGDDVSGLRQKPTEEVKQLCEKLVRVQVANAKVASSTAPMSKSYK